MKKLCLTIGDRSYNVEIGDPLQSPIEVTVDGEKFSVKVELEGEGSGAAATPGRGVLPGTAEAAGDGGPQVIAPMPGTIMEIAVQVGDQVRPGQVLCALEAMKMKSPIRASRGGRVRQIAVREGQTVVYGDLLFEVE